jgi:cytochrome c oxidase subunit I+III
MLAYQGMHVIGMIVCALFLCARAWNGRVSEQRRATLDNVNLMWHYTTLQGIVLALAVQLLPSLMQ